MLNLSSFYYRLDQIHPVLSKKLGSDQKAQIFLNYKLFELFPQAAATPLRSEIIQYMYYV